MVIKHMSKIIKVITVTTNSIVEKMSVKLSKEGGGGYKLAKNKRVLIIISILVMVMNISVFGYPKNEQVIIGDHYFIFSYKDPGGVLMESSPKRYYDSINEFGITTHEFHQGWTPSYGTDGGDITDSRLIYYSRAHNYGDTDYIFKSPGTYWVYTNIISGSDSDFTEVLVSEITITTEDFKKPNTAPTITVTNNNQLINNTGNITISGTVTDPDAQTLTISATINNIKKTQTIQGPVVNKPFTLSWQGSELSQGTYGTVHVTVNDTFETQTVNHIGVKTVDKIKPKLNISMTK